MKGELKKIKKKYGEDMAKLCRELFPTILETDGLLYSILDSKFSHSRFLYYDLVKYGLVNKFKDYIYGLIERVKNDVEINKTTSELMSEAGYNLYECKSEDEIQSFKKYYAKGEELCTFRGNRLDKCYVFFAVKKNVSEIRREDFDNPERQDLYGTSVISIQFTRDSSNTLSIKNRYNHRVNNPDATFSNNLDNIIKGLTISFERNYGLSINSGENYFEIPGYVLANDGKYYKYNYEINNVYYGPDNLIIDNFEVKKEFQDKSRYLVFDYFIIDLSLKEIKLYDAKIKDSFIDDINIHSLVILNSEDKNYKRIIINNDIEIIIDKEDKLIEYHNSNLRKLNDNFLINNKSLKILDTPNIMKVGNNCLYFNNSIESINLPKVLYVGKKFQYSNKKLREINMDNVLFIDDYFCFGCENLEIINMIRLEQIGNYFCRLAKNVKNLFLTNLVTVLDDFMSSNRKIENIYTPNLKEVGNNFLFFASNAKNFYAPKLKKYGDGCFTMNSEILKKKKKIK